MAKPYKLNSPYFPHDLDAKNDKKLVKLRKELSWAAMSLYWEVIAALHKSQGWLDLSDIATLAFEFSVEEGLLNNIVRNYQLFHFEGESFTSHRVLRNLEHIKEKSEQGKKAAFSRWGNKKGNAGALPE